MAEDSLSPGEPQLSLEASARLAAFRLRALEALVGELERYWQEPNAKHPCPKNLLGFFRDYAVAVLDAHAQEFVPLFSSAEDYGAFVGVLAERIVNDILPPPSGTKLPVIPLEQGISSFYRQFSDPGEYYSEFRKLEGKWEDATEESWVRAIRLERVSTHFYGGDHPFIRALRKPVNRATVQEELLVALERRIRPHQGQWYTRKGQVPEGRDARTPHLEPTAITARVTKTKKRGPTPNVEEKRRVAQIVERVADGKPWKDCLEEICKALDEAEIPFPQTWLKRDQKMENWHDGYLFERRLAEKAIEYRLDSAD